MITSARKVRPIIPHPSDPTAALVELTKGYWAVIDAADAAEVGRYSWTASVGTHTVYAFRKNNGKNEYLHRFVARLAGRLGIEIDHKNGNGIDCRRSNLRPATRAGNGCNLRGNSRNTSGVKGLHWDKNHQRWTIQLQVNRKVIHLGIFADKEEAIEKLRKAREELHGDFANHGSN